VRSPEGTVDIDVTGKRNGRGAYLCSEPGCWDKALSAGILARALHTTLDAGTREKLRAHGEGLSVIEDGNPATDASHKE